MSIHVLIVEKNIQVREAVTQMMFLCGCQAVPVDTADRGLGALVSIKFDFIIVGISPGDQSVAGFVYAARSQQRTVCIVVGNTYAAETSTEGLVDAYLPFPMSIHELRSAMERAIKNSSKRINSLESARRSQNPS